MKRKIYTFSTFFLALIFSALCFVGCKQNKAVTGDYAVIVADDVTDGDTLLDYMKELRDEGSLSFESTTGDYGEYVTSINGKAQSGNSYWMLYTSDTDYASNAYTVTYEGQTYGQATLGASSLPIKEGATYIWYYETF